MRRVGDNPDRCLDDGWHKEIVCKGETPHTRMIKHHCWDRACPACSRAWAVRGSKRSAARLEGLAALFTHLPRHIIISAPVGFFSENSTLAEMRKTFKNIALASGLHGGALVIHAWREHNRGTGDWYFSPHAHLIAWGRVASRPVGWVIKVIRAIGQRGDAEATLAYELDHAAYEGSGSALVWYGSVGYARIATEYVRYVDTSSCVICGADEVEMNLDAESGEMVEIYHLEPHYTAKCTKRASKPRSKARKRSKWASLRSPSRARA